MADINETNFNEVNDMDQQEQEIGNEIPNEVPESHEEKQEDDKPVKKPGKVKRFFKAAWKVTKKVTPFAGVYALGYATKAVLGKVTGSQATTTGESVPALPEVKTETIDLGDGVKAEVTNF